MSASAPRGGAERAAALAVAALIALASGPGGGAWAALPPAGPARAGPDSARAEPGVPADTVKAPAAPDSAAPARPDQAVRAPAAAENLPIRSIRVHTRGIFDPPPPGRLRPLYRLVDVLHIRTHPATVVQQLPFEPGERWTAERGREAMRILRDFDILVPEKLEVTPVEGQVDIAIETRDAWTTAVEFTAAGANNKLSGSISVVESNLLGWGKKIAFAYREDLVAISRSVEFRDPAVFGSRLRLAVGGADGSDGASHGFSIGMPFYAQTATAGFGVEWARSTSIARLFYADQEVASFDRRRERAELWMGRGHAHGGTILRGIVSLRIDDRRFGPTRLGAGAPADFAGGEENHRVRQPTLEGWWWRPRFVERQVINELAGIEDFDLGRQVRLAAGISPHAFGATADEGYVRVVARAGAEVPALGFGWLATDASTRLRRIAREGEAGLDARWFAPMGRGHLLALAVRAEALLRPARDRQVMFGGLNGLRAFGVNELAGESGWRFNVEERWTPQRELFHVVRLGTAVFLDAARVHGPGVGDSGLRQNVGVGLRVSLPRAALHRVARLDVAWSLGGARGRSGPVLSFGSSQAF